MKRVFIFFAVALLVSCKKEVKQIATTRTTTDTTKTATQLPPPTDTTKTVTQTTSDTVIYTTGQIQFTKDGITYQFTDSIIAKQYIQYGLMHIFIEVKKGTSTFQINIVGDSTQISPGTYPFVLSSSFVANSSMFMQWVRYGWDVGYLEQDFSLQVLSYQNGYLNATFHSGRVSNGIIKDLKVIPT